MWLGAYCAFDEAFEWHFPQQSGQSDFEHFSPWEVPGSVGGLASQGY